MGSSDPAPASPLGARYWAGLAAACGLAAALAALNVAVDPLGVFGHSQAHALNRTLPPSVIARIDLGPPSDVHRQAIRQSGADVFLIGSSRVARGFDICGRPEVMRLAGSSWDVRELATAGRMAARERTRPATLLIEVGLPSDDGAPEPDARAATVHAALSPRTTSLSLKTVALNLLGGGVAQGIAACHAKPTPAADWRLADMNFQRGQRLLDVSPASLGRGQAILSELVDDLDRSCRRSGLSHTVVFFTLPPTPPHEAAVPFKRRLEESSRQIAKRLAAASSAPEGCRFIHLDMASHPPGSPSQQALWRDRAHWSDYTHFSPRLGGLALEALLAAASAPLPSPS